MKKLLVSMMLILGMLAFAAESAPSATVGYVKYNCVTTAGLDNNLVAIPLDAGFANASDLDPTGTTLNQVSKYDAATQSWNTADYNAIFGMWLGDFAVTEGMGLMINALSDFDFIVDGDLVTVPSYNLVTTAGLDNNLIMHPLTKSSLATAADIGDDIGACNQVSKYDAATQSWNTADYNAIFGMWLGDFASDIANPLMVNVTADVAWPGAKSDYVEGDKATPKGTARSIYVSVVDATSTAYSFPDPSVTFKAWIVGRESELLQEPAITPSSSQAMLATYSYCAVNIGNFPTAWAAGETVMFRPKDESEGTWQKVYYESNTGDASYLLDASSTAVYIGFEPAMPGSGTPLVLGTPSSIDGTMPLETKLEQNYPNPFNPTTTINFSMKNEGIAKLNVYNYTGQLVNSLVDGQMNAGNHSVNFDASNLSAGVYYYTLEADNKTMTNKMVLVK